MNITAKFFLSKIIAIPFVGFGILFFFFPEILVNLFGIKDLLNNDIYSLVVFLIRLYAARNIAAAVILFAARSSFSVQVALWASSLLALLDAVSGSSLTIPNAVRYQIVLWILPLLILFFIGLAYGIDIMRKRNGQVEVEKTEEVEAEESLKQQDQSANEPKTDI